MILAADVGGTKVHLALFEESRLHTVVQEHKYRSREFSDFSSLLETFLSRCAGAKIEKACFGVAGPVYQGRCQATNLPWVIDAAQLSLTTQIPQIFLINDLEANAWGIPRLQADELYTLNQGSQEVGNQALIAAGTGLGEAGLYWDGERHVPFACEGGHTDFAAESEEEVELWRYLKESYGHVSYERILSGAGINRLYRFLVDVRGAKENPAVKSAEEPQRIISEQALARACPTCVRTLDLFTSIYGSEAGNLALKMLAVAGLYVGGGIAPKILPHLKAGTFVRSFTSKGRFAPLLAKIPVKVILNENTALLGAAQYACQKK